MPDGRTGRVARNYSPISRNHHDPTFSGWPSRRGFRRCLSGRRRPEHGQLLWRFGVGRSVPMTMSLEDNLLNLASVAGSTYTSPPTIKLAEGSSMVPPAAGTTAGSAYFAGRLTEVVRYSNPDIISRATTSSDSSTMEISMAINTHSRVLRMSGIGTTPVLLLDCLGRSSARDHYLLQIGQTKLRRMNQRKITRHLRKDYLLGAGGSLPHNPRQRKHGSLGGRH